jgi:hypothetical protein
MWIFRSFPWENEKNKRELLISVKVNQRFPRV